MKQYLVTDTQVYALYEDGRDVRADLVEVPPGTRVLTREQYIQDLYEVAYGEKTIVGLAIERFGEEVGE